MMKIKGSEAPSATQICSFSYSQMCINCHAMRQTLTWMRISLAVEAISCITSQLSLRDSSFNGSSCTTKTPQQLPFNRCLISIRDQSLLGRNSSLRILAQEWNHRNSMQMQWSWKRSAKSWSQSWVGKNAQGAWSATTMSSFWIKTSSSCRDQWRSTRRSALSTSQSHSFTGSSSKKTNSWLTNRNDCCILLC